MAESIFLRVRRVLSGRIEDRVDQMERSGGVSVMREAIREADRALDQVKADHEDATARRLNAVRQQKLFRERAEGLEDKARFALDEGRDELAESAVSRQLDFERQAERLTEVQAQAAEEEAKLVEAVAALTTRKQQMVEALGAYEMAQVDAGLGGDGPRTPGREVEKAVTRAEDAFDRAMSGSGGLAATRADARTIADVAEIDVMEKSRAVSDRLAALKAKKAA